MDMISYASMGPIDQYGYVMDHMDHTVGTMYDDVRACHPCSTRGSSVRVSWWQMQHHAMGTGHHQPPEPSLRPWLRCSSSGQVHGATVDLKTVTSDQ